MNENTESGNFTEELQADLQTLVIPAPPTFPVSKQVVEDLLAFADISD